jgi:uncharacterized protein (DUF433 family)
MSTVSYPHIELTSDGVAILSGTSTKVIEIALDRLAYRWGADENLRQHPHLSLAQIFSALAYYYDHQAAMDSAIQSQLDDIHDIKRAEPDTPLKLKLKAMGRLR